MMALPSRELDPRRRMRKSMRYDPCQPFTRQLLPTSLWPLLRGHPPARTVAGLEQSAENGRAASFGHNTMHIGSHRASSRA